MTNSEITNLFSNLTNRLKHQRRNRIFRISDITITRYL